MFGSQVTGFGRVATQVVQLPLVVAERRQGAVPGDDLPAVAVVAAVALHLVVLLAVCLRSGGIGD